MFKISPPLWFQNANHTNQNFIKDILKSYTQHSRDLENRLIDECGASRSDIKDLVLWWFSEYEVEEYVSKILFLFSINIRK